MYLIAGVDRNNISFGLSGIEKDLGVTPEFAGLVAGIFFVGYMLLQIPAAYLAVRWSARKYITLAMLAWGVFSLLTGLVRTSSELLIVRTLVGVAEGGVWPATLILLAQWFPLKERARANAVWMFCVPLGSFIMSPISGYLIQVANWRLMFIIEAIPAILFALVWFVVVADDPSQAAWLSDEERNHLTRELAAEQNRAEDPRSNFAAALKDVNVWLLLAVSLLANCGLYGFSVWLPTVVKQISGSNYFGVGVISALPWAGAILGGYLFARSSDRTGEYRKHVALALGGAGLFLLFAVLVGNASPIIGVLALILCMTFFWGFEAVFFAFPGTFLRGSVLGATLGLLTLGNIGGFVGPYVVGYITTAQRSTIDAEMFLAAVLLVAGVLMLLVRLPGRVGSGLVPGMDPSDPWHP